MRDLNGEKFVRPSFDELMWYTLGSFERPDFVCSPRGSEIKEIIAPRLVLTNPRNRLLTAPSRKANYGFGVGEFLWYERGSNSLEEMQYYNKRMSGFSDDGKTLNSAYGHIMHGMLPLIGSAASIDQWSNVIETLLEDKDSRRAVAFIAQPCHINKATQVGSKDVPCTLSLQFFIRNDKLHLHVNMRSNDVHWGLTYDLFSFTLMQEVMMLELRKRYPNLELGRYFHTAGSLHIYERHYQLTKDMDCDYREKAATQNRRQNSIWFTEPMKPLESLEELELLQEFEQKLREDGKVDLKLLSDNVSPTIRWMATQLVNHRKKRDEE